MNVKFPVLKQYYVIKDSHVNWVDTRYSDVHFLSARKEVYILNLYEMTVQL